MFGMELDENIKSFVFKYTKYIEVFQWSVMASVSTLFYMEYVRCMKKSSAPGGKIHAPSISRLQNDISSYNTFMTMVKSKLIDSFMNDERLTIFKDDPYA